MINHPRHIKIQSLLFVFLVLLGTISLKAQVNPCAQDTTFHFVILGSSTAAGSGASPSDSSWVNRYRSYLQSLNPGYQVTNLAVGGFTTYRIMPTGFTPPSGRPSPDVNRNITQALSLSPDAIIVNLPSNDVSQGYTVAEQLENFDTIVAHANAAGVPIWICTTQPKNYGGNQTPIQKQMDVRDSIWVNFGPRVLDFWTGLADSSNQLESYYDSGDGTHLNNTGHYLLFTRARDEDIPGHLYSPPAYVDYAPIGIDPIYAPDCGDSAAIFSLKVLSRGQADTGVVNVSIEVIQSPNNQQTNHSFQFVNGIPTCSIDSNSFTVNTVSGGTYNFTAIVNAANDLRADNDTIRWSASYLGVPMPTVTNDTGCSSGNLMLMAMADPGDSIRWFDAQSGGNFLGGGSQLTVTNLPSSSTFYAEAIRGDFFFREELATTTSNNINFNGAMFDLFADSTLVLDSFALKVTTTGNQTVEVYTRPGTHLGYETNSAAWSYYGAYNVQVTNTADFVTIGDLGLPMNAGDTLGVYLQLQNSGSNLGYQSVSSPITRTTGELTIITGSGAAHNFGGNYFPRDWNGRIFFHYGLRPDGECLGPRVPVEALVSNPAIFLGNDTILNVSSSITISPGTGYSAYQWSNGSTGSTLTLDGNVLGTGVYPISVQVTDTLGCMVSDTIIVVFAPLVSSDPLASAQFKIGPNPASNEVRINMPPGITVLELQDLQGRVLNRWEEPGLEKALRLDQYPNGFYLLKIRGSLEESRKLIIRR